jgi:peptidoglycan-N-acetylmuramic acid deacetylase
MSKQQQSNTTASTTTAENTNAAATTQKQANATYTGLPPLSEVTLTVSDPENSKGLPTAKIEHSYGVSKDAKPNQISIDSEAFFESKGYKAVTYDSRTESKVLYLTFDCGYENGYTAKILDVLKEKQVPAAFFCTLDDIKEEPQIIARMINEGHIVGNHSHTHPSFPSLSRSQMAKEIQDCDNYLRTNFGYTSKFFRFPKGDYSECALDLVQSVGFVSVFWSLSYSDWDTNEQKGADYAFEKVTQRLHPGAIMLLHAVSSDNAGALGRIIDYAREQGYEFSTLDKIPSIQ